MINYQLQEKTRTSVTRVSQPSNAIGFDVVFRRFLFLFLRKTRRRTQMAAKEKVEVAPSDWGQRLSAAKNWEEKLKDIRVETVRWAARHGCHGDPTHFRLSLLSYLSPSPHPYLHFYRGISKTSRAELEKPGTFEGEGASEQNKTIKTR